MWKWTKLDMMTKPTSQPFPVPVIIHFCSTLCQMLCSAFAYQFSKQNISSILLQNNVPVPMSFFHYSSSSCSDLSSGCWVFPVSLRGLQQVPSEWCCWRTCPTQTSWRGHTCIEAISSGNRRWFYVTISPSKCWKTHVSVRIWGGKIHDKHW